MAFAPFLVGIAVGVVLFAVLALTLSVTVTAAQWATASRDVAALLRSPTVSATADAGTSQNPRPFAAGGAATLPAAMHDVLSSWLVPGLRTGTVTSDDPDVRRTMWRQVASGLTEGDRRELQEDASTPSLDTWRSLASMQAELPLWVYDDVYNGAASPSGVPLLVRDTIVGLAFRNESAAILAADIGDTPTALRHARETLAIGFRLRDDPMHGWLAPDVLTVGARMIREIGLLQGDRSLLLEAEGLDALMRQRHAPWLVVRSAAALMGRRCRHRRSADHRRCRPLPLRTLVGCDGRGCRFLQ